METNKKMEQLEVEIASVNAEIVSVKEAFGTHMQSFFAFANEMQQAHFERASLVHNQFNQLVIELGSLTKKVEFLEGLYQKKITVTVDAE